MPSAKINEHMPPTTSSYPSRSLHFLRSIQSPDTDPERQASKVLSSTSPLTDGSIQAPLRFNVIIVGAGLGGLAAGIALAKHGHSVTILEQAAALGEVGAGIQIPPNSAKILIDWGLGPFLEGTASEPEGITFRRWKDGSAIGYTKLVPSFRNSFGAPYCVVHRAHLHDALHQLALQLGVKVKLDHKVVKYKEGSASQPSVEVKGGACFTADLVVAADGVKSLAREHILGKSIYREAQPTGFAAYRATVDVAKMREDPDMAWLLNKPALNIWIGHERHVMTYTIASGKSFNMVLSHIDRSDPATWVQETAVEDMKTYFRGWDSRLCKIINMIDSTLKWPLISVDLPDDRWVSPSGRVAMLGDAAHAMVPYMSQGAAMAVEDAAALAASLAHVVQISDLSNALGIYERVRGKRTTQMQEASSINGTIWHFEDGPEQEARDRAMQPEVNGEHFIESPNQWSDPVTQNWAYAYDAVEAIKKKWVAFDSGTWIP